MFIFIIYTFCLSFTKFYYQWLHDIPLYEYSWSILIFYFERFRLTFHFFLSVNMVLTSIIVKKALCILCTHTHLDRVLQVNLYGSECKRMVKVVKKNCQIALQNVDWLPFSPAGYERACRVTQEKHLVKTGAWSRSDPAEARVLTRSAKNRQRRLRHSGTQPWPPPHT